MFLLVLALCGVAAAMSGRVLDPVVPAVAHAFGTTIASIALLSTAYAFPFAISQPVLGPLGDLFPKALIIKVAVALLALFLALGAMAPDLPTLFGTRIVAGVASAGIVPVGFALIGDRVALAGRQLAISRFVAATLIGQLVGASTAGILGEAVGWRGVLWISALITLAVAAAAILFLPRGATARSEPVHLRMALANYRRVLRNPLAYACFTVVLVEGAAIYGALPFIGAELQRTGNGGPREAGFVIAGLAIGGLCYAMAVPLLLRFLRRRQMMAAGAACAAAGLACLGVSGAWPVETAFTAATGFGFFMLHNSVQTEVSELAPEARASAFALHAFSFYLGQALGPALYGQGAHQIGLAASLDIAAACVFAVGVLGYRTFR